MTVITATRNKTDPIWLKLRSRHSPTNDFLDSPKRSCLHQQGVFWSEDLSDQVIARSICAKCPCFRDCTAWALYSEECDTEYFIVAGMDPNERLRIREGRQPWRDWRRDFNYTQRAARAASRKREHKNMGKRDQRLIVPCPVCYSGKVYRDGRDRETNRQKYTCESCGTSFLGEEL